MLRFAYWVALAGVTSALGWALLVAVGAPSVDQPRPYIVQFVSVFFSFGPAVLAHPARTGSGGSYSVDWSVFRAAAPWTQVLLALCVLALFGGMLLAFPGGDQFTIDRAALRGRVDRQLFLCSFFALFHAVALAVASSGLRWWLVPPGGGWFWMRLKGTSSAPPFTP